jgi:choline dehydrogenase-like flavoprotein
MTIRYDIIIIGTGAGGGTLAYGLAPTGKRILMLDRGEFLPREKANWDPQAVYMEGKYRTDQRWRNPEGDRIQPNLYHRVGGNTKVYGAALLRMHPKDFDAVTHFEGTSPAWPITYDDLASYYTDAEQLYWVHGQQGSDPLEPPRSGPFPFPPLPHEPHIHGLKERLVQQGLRPFALPMGIKRNSENPVRSSCIRCNTCDGYPCLVDAKADAQVCCVDPALKYENVSLITGAHVHRLVTDETGERIQRVEATVNGHDQSFAADTVVVSCGATNSAALLLRSACQQHPQGLANGSDQVGRNLMKHNASKLFAIDQRSNPTVFQKTLGINDFYFGTEGDPYPLGHVHLMGKHSWEMMQPDFPSLPLPLLKLLTSHSVDWWLQSEDLPESSNRIRVNNQGEIQVDYRANNLEAHRRLCDRTRTVLKQAGFRFTLKSTVPLQVLNHQAGTCRFGTDPATSVLDLNCRTHDINNLYVVDSSFFPSNPAVNPTLTIVANALRVADHLKQQMQ